MLFSLSVIILASLLVYSISSKRTKAAPIKAAAPEAANACINEDTDEAVNALAEYSISLQRRAEALSKAAKQAKQERQQLQTRHNINPTEATAEALAKADLKVAKLEADAARLYAQSANQALRASKLANKARR